MPTEPAPVEKFRPTNGEILGWGSIAALAVLLVVAVVSEPNLTGVRVALGFAVAMVAVWAVLLRPRATAYADTLVLRNMVSDTHLPLAEVDDVSVRHTLNVWVGEARYVCAGIGRSTRQMTGRRSRGALSAIGLQQADDRMGIAQVGQIGSGSDYATFVETRIEDLARSARRDLRGEPPPVRRLWAVPELAALGLFVAGFAATFVVG